MENPLKYFAELTDPRVERNREHLLEEILLLAIAAVLSGAESWNDIEDYGQAKIEWLKTFLTLPSGIPSHDTFNRWLNARWRRSPTRSRPFRNCWKRWN